MLFFIHYINKIESHTLSLEELALTRKELSDSTLAQKLQADTLKLQLEETKETAKKERFDNTFNSLLEQHNSTLNMLENGLLIQNGLTLKEEFDKLHENALYCRYFRLLYQILKFIAIEHSPENELNSSLFNSRIEYKEKFYSNIIRSMIPDHVLYWLAINCYCPKGESDPYIFYRKLILRYKFLEHLTLSNGKLDNIYDGFSYRKNCLILLSYDKNDLGDNLHLTNINNELLMLENSLKPKFTPKQEPDPKNQYNYKVVPNKYSVSFEILPNVVDESKLTLLSYWCGYLNRFVNNSNNKKYHGYMINIVNTISITEYSEIYNKK
ncbi:putative phage abortive infection protein [Photobacterium leiognathi]|uniref:putative phage abortive infection protein n=1 Tax=Photobacterium leiognathi TaxID=553611 RepID=UPI0027339910|nr:putative phage abortive infection protein [Photobacterium leiognathi]